MHCISSSKYHEEKSRRVRGSRKNGRMGGPGWHPWGDVIWEETWMKWATGNTQREQTFKCSEIGGLVSSMNRKNSSASWEKGHGVDGKRETDRNRERDKDEKEDMSQNT